MAATRKFYHKGQPLYEFTNFAEGYPFQANLVCDNGQVISGTWLTSEYLFQAAKFVNRPDLVEKIRVCITPRKVHELTNGKNGTIRAFGLDKKTWQARSVDVMRWVVYTKFKSSSTLQNKLLETGNDELIEDTESDKNPNGTPKNPWEKDWFWGNATKYNGEPGDNMLGKVLQEVREIFREESLGHAPIIPQQPFAPSPQPTPPPPPVPDENDRVIVASDRRNFEDWVGKELRKKGIELTDLSSEFHNYSTIIRDFSKIKQLTTYQNEMELAIACAANEKFRDKPNDAPPAPSPQSPCFKITPTYRDRWIKEVERRFQECQFGFQYDNFANKFREFKARIKSSEFERQDRLDSFINKFLDLLRKLPPKNSGDNSSIISSLLEQLEKLNQQTVTELNSLLEQQNNKSVDLEVVRKYFVKHDINSILLRDNGELLIKFNNQSIQETLADSYELCQIKLYFRQSNRNFLEVKELNINPSHDTNSPNYLPLKIGIGVMILIIVFLFMISHRKKVKKSNLEKSL